MAFTPGPAWANAPTPTPTLTPTAKPKAKPAPAAGPKPSTADAALLGLFRQYGLADLAQFLIDKARQGVQADQAYLELQETKTWKTRFVGNEIRKQKGLAALSPSEYLSKEADLRSVMGPDGFGLPAGFYDQPADFAKAIGADIGRAELTRRLTARKAIVTDGAYTGVFQYAKDKYGLSDGDLIAYFIDPERAANLLEKISSAAAVGAAGRRTGWGDISAAEAERIAALGFSGEQAQGGFGQAADMLALTENLDGDKGVDKDDLLDATFGDDAEAKRRVTRKREERAGRFQGGGGYAEGRGGITGLGSATTR